MKTYVIQESCATFAKFGYLFLQNLSLILALRVPEAEHVGYDVTSSLSYIASEIRTSLRYLSSRVSIRPLISIRAYHGTSFWS